MELYPLMFSNLVGILNTLWGSLLQAEGDKLSEKSYEALFQAQP